MSDIRIVVWAVLSLVSLLIVVFVVAQIQVSCLEAEAESNFHQAKKRWEEAAKEYEEAKKMHEQSETRFRKFLMERKGVEKKR